MITDVGIDLDGVMFDFATVVTKHFSDYLGTDLPEPSTWQFFDEWGLTALQFYSILDLLTEERELFNDSSPIYKTMVGWKDLRAQGLRLHIITHRAPASWGQTIKWLERYRIIPDSLHFSGDKADVLTSIALDECASIDDHVEQYQAYDARGVHTYLMTQEWNKHYPARRVRTLPEFANIIRVHNEFHTLQDKYTAMAVPQ